MVTSIVENSVHRDRPSILQNFTCVSYVHVIINIRLGLLKALFEKCGWEPTHVLQYIIFVISIPKQAPTNSFLHLNYEYLYLLTKYI